MGSQAPHEPCALEGSSPRGLGSPHGPQLLGKQRHEPQGDGKRHREVAYGQPQTAQGGEQPAQRLGKLCRRGKRREQKTRPYQQKQPEGHRDSRKPPRGCNIVDEQEADKEVGEGPFAQQTGNGDVPDGGHGRSAAATPRPRRFSVQKSATE